MTSSYRVFPKEVSLQAIQDNCTVTEQNCWLWNRRLKYGYAFHPMKLDGFRFQRVHRLAYYLKHGELDKDLTVHHSCAVRACVNPEHLQLITSAENIAEMHERANYRTTITILKKKIATLEKENQLLRKANATT